MTLTLVVTAFAVTLALTLAITLTIALLAPVRASAHCDTMAGPTAQDGLLALESGNLAAAAKWVTASAEGELREVFEAARAARDHDPVAREAADRWFVETLVRIHRAGEGAAFTGVQPYGVPVDERVAAADLAVASGDLTPLRGLVPEERWGELERRFAAVLDRSGYDVTDVAAGRAYVAAYVSFFKYAEGHDHSHDHSHEHSHGPAHAGHGH